MKKITKILLAFMMTVITAIVFFTVSPEVKAAEEGTLTSNSIKLKEDDWYTKYWTNSNYSLNCYNKISVPSRGYITFTIQKPYDWEGEIGAFTLTLYNPDGEVVWEANTKPQASTFSENYVYKIGLNKGTYYMNFDPRFTVDRNSAPIPTTYKYNFTETKLWEIEGNDTKETATKISLGKMYNAVYSEQSYNYSYVDYFVVNLKKNVKYRVKFENYEKVKGETSMLFSIFTPSGEDLRTSKYVTTDNVTYWDITAKETGKYYLYLYNSGNKVGSSYKIGVEEKNCSVKKLDISVSSEPLKYNGENKTPTIIVKDGDEKLKKNVHYTIKLPSERKKIGEYTATLIFDHPNYNGKRTVKFKIVPGTVKSSKIKTATTTSSIKITWPKVAGASGYKIYQYNTRDRKFVQVGQVTGTSYTKKNLESGTTYEYKIKAIKKIGKKVFSGEFSKAFKITTKIETPYITNVYSFPGQEINVCWTRANEADGYHVYYSTKKDSGYERLLISTTTIGKKYFSSSYVGKTVYFKVRAYKNVNGKTMYSKWSPVESAVVK